MPSLTDLARLEPYAQGVLQAVVETPGGSRNKYTYDEERRCFSLKKVLPAGMTFPYEFGFIPRTRAGDGDAIDVLLLTDAPTFPGCVLGIRLIGVLVGEDHLPDGGIRRNDRLLTVACASHVFADIHDIDALPATLVRQLEEFFQNYPRILREKEFRLLGTKGPAQAQALVQAALEAYSS